LLIASNIPLVLLSALVAMIGPFTALTHIQRMRESSGRLAWICSGYFTALPGKYSAVGAA
jgi:NO-binding membrane sensor protein with MHYT domain